MSKEIIRIIQNDEGGENPKTKLPEKPLWELVFEDNTIRVLGKPKMEEYLSKAYENTVHHFTRRTSLLRDQRKIIQWCVVFSDYSDVLLSSSELCKKIMLGHQRKDEEKYLSLDESLARKNAPQNPVLFSEKTDPYPHLTKDREELDRLRLKAIEEAKNEEENTDIVQGEY